MNDNTLTDYPYISKVSVGNFFVLKNLIEGENLEIYADVVVYLNSFGVLMILLFNIFLRGRLYNYNRELDDD